MSGKNETLPLSIIYDLKKKVNVDSSQCFFNGCKVAPGLAIGEPVNLSILQQSQKLSFYCTIKDDYSPSPYLV